VRGETLAVLRETHATTVIVTHDPEEAMVLGDRIALLRGGVIVQIDTASAIYTSPADINVARFFSPLSEIAGVVRDGKVETPLGPVPTPAYPDGARVVLGIRPVGVLRLGAESDGVPGRIVSKHDALGIDIYEVGVAGIDRPIVIRRAANPDLTPGSDVFLKLDPTLVLVFDED
jgi:iron(III) transport system ATP-binding protein